MIPSPGGRPARSCYTGAHENRGVPGHSDVSPYFRSMGPLELLWYFAWRMVPRTVSCGVILGLPIALLTEIPFYAVGDAEEVVDALAPGALVGGFLGALPGVLCGLRLAVLTFAFRRPPRRTTRYRMTAVAACAGGVFWAGWLPPQAGRARL